MNDQSQTAKQSESSRCNKGCGFFGNAATGGLCSKCWRDEQKTKSAVAAAVVAPASPEAVCTKVVDKVEPLKVDASVAPTESAATVTPKSSSEAAAAAPATTTVTETPTVPTESAPNAAVANAPAKKKKKKKKTSYKNMMASMMLESSRNSSEKDTAKDDAIRKVTGGGAFSKIDKI